MMRSRRGSATAAFAVVIASIVTGLALVAQEHDYRGWAAYGGGPDQIRYSSLQQINRSNVKRLQVAWTYDTGETGAMQTQPVIVGNVLYGYTPSHKTFALRADTGAHLWTFDPKVPDTGPNRGVMVWQGGGERRVFAAV